MKRLELGKLLYEFSRLEPPRLKINSGETVLVETEDALSGQIRQPGDRRDKSKMPYSNPVTGPIYVEDAAPGDSLAIYIESIVPSSGQCATYTGSPRGMTEWLGTDCPHGAHVCPIENDTIHFLPGIDIPYDPMIGCIGTAPDWGMPTTGPAGPHGGNMDIIEVRPGNTLYLPVLVPGALLSLGDAHAAMGHGELSATGLEMAAHITITVTLLKGKTIPTPRIESPDEIMVVTSGSPTERSTAEAYARLILWMEADYGWNRWLAYDLLTHVGRISVGYYGIGTVAVKVGKKYLK
jgi:amidase